MYVRRDAYVAIFHINPSNMVSLGESEGFHMEPKNIYDELYNATADKLKQEFGDIQIQRTNTIKNNGDVRDTITARMPDSRVGIPLYINDFADAVNVGATVDDVSDKMFNIFKKHINDQIELPVLDYEHSKRNLAVTVVNKSMNTALIEDGAVYQDIPGTDLMLTVRYRMPSVENGYASFLVKREHLASLQVTADEAIEFGKINSIADGYSCKTMNEIMMELGIPEQLQNELSIDAIPMYVVTNNEKMYGATGIFIDKDLRKEIFDEVNNENGYYILPSSIHETIVVPADLDEEALRNMVMDINRNDVAMDELLSNNVFFCDSKLQLHMSSMDELENIDELADSLEILDSDKACMHL